MTLFVAWVRWLSDVLLNRHRPPELDRHDNDGILRIEDYRYRDWSCTRCEIGWASLMPLQNCPQCGEPAEQGHVLLLMPRPNSASAPSPGRGDTRPPAAARPLA